MELNGQLRGFELVDLLQMIGLGKKTGMLLVRSLDEWIALVIEEGKLARILSQEISYGSFGELLIEMGILDEEIVTDVLELQQYAIPQRRLGEIMKDYGLDRDSVEQTVFHQVRTLMTQILSWKEGNFSLHLGTVPVEKLSAGIRQIKFDQPLEILDILLLAWQEVSDSQQIYMNEEAESGISRIDSTDLECLIMRLVRVDEAVSKGEELSPRVRLSAIRSFMSELSACNSQREALMLLLRAAGEVAGRGLLIQMENRDLYDLGHYNSVPNPDCETEEIDDSEDMISVDADCLTGSILGRACAAEQPIIINWSEVSDDNEANRWLRARLGLQTTSRVRAFLIPVQSNGSTLVLYGDDATWPIDFEQLGELEIILYQAVLIMERLRFDRVCRIMTHSYFQAA